MAEFHETGYGRVFFEAQLPELIGHLDRVATALEKLEPPTITQDPAVLQPAVSPATQADREALVGILYNAIEKREPNATAVHRLQLASECLDALEQRGLVNRKVSIPPPEHQIELHKASNVEVMRVIAETIRREFPPLPRVAVNNATDVIYKALNDSFLIHWRNP